MTVSPRNASGSSSSLRHKAAFTLIELLMVITIVMVLASVAWVGGKGATKRAERAACAENLKSLHIALGIYTQNIGHWPQVPPPQADEEVFWKSWKAKLARYDLPDKVWMCPSHLRATRDETAPYSSYLPAQFEGTSPNVPHQWATQPWLIEIGDNHGQGPLAIFPDGSIDTMVSPEKSHSSLERR